MTVPQQETIERRLVTQKAAARVQVPFDYDPDRQQSIRRYFLRLDPPDYSDQTDDWSRVQRELARQGVRDVRTSLPVLRQMGDVLRGEFASTPASHRGDPRQDGEGDTAWEPWEVTAVVALDRWDAPQGPGRSPRDPAGRPGRPQLRRCHRHRHHDRQRLAGRPGDAATWWRRRLTTTARSRRGEDVISRIIYAKKPGQLEELQGLVVGTINRLLEAACKQVDAAPGRDLQG